MNRPPRDNLIRAQQDGLTLEDDGKTLFGRISPAGEWSEIQSSVEGHFMERSAPGAFRKTFAEKTPKILFNHGKDPTLGSQIIAEPREVGEDAISGFYRAEILDGLPPLLVDGLKRNLYGSSHQFGVVRETWVDKPSKSDYNPQGLPERTIVEARVMEMGPVTWPAYAGATAGVRSMTDEYTLDALAADPERLATIIEAKTGAPVPSTPPPGTSSERAADVVVPPKAIPQEKDVEYNDPAARVSRISELEATITRQATEYTGRMPADVQSAYDSNKVELAELRLDQASFESRQADVLALATDRRHLDDAKAAPAFIRKSENIYDLAAIRSETRTRDEFDTKVRENALRSIESQRSVKDLGYLSELVEFHDEGTGDNGERATGALAQRILATGSPVYRRAFAKYLARGNTDTLSPEERAAIAVVGTTTTGGYAVPYIFDPTMFHSGVWTAENPFRRACRTVTITNGNNWRTVTVGAITSAYTTEAAAASENAPAFTQPTYTVLRAQAFATVSIETLEDRPDITPELTSVFAESKDTLEENKFAVGAGTTVPLGMFTDTAYTNQDTATDNVTAIADLQVLEGALPLRYRANAAFFMNRSTLRQLLALDTTYRYFSGAGIQFPGNPQPTQNGSNGGGNTGFSLLGYPVWEVPSAVSTLTADGAIIVVFCDPKSYIIVDRIGMNVEVVPTMLNGATPSFPTGQRGIYVYWRNYAAPILADAGRSLSVQ